MVGHFVTGAYISWLENSGNTAIVDIGEENNENIIRMIQLHLKHVRYIIKAGIINCRDDFQTGE